MIDIAALRADPACFTAAWNDRGLSVDVAALVAADEAVRKAKFEAERLRAEANAAAKDIGAAARRGEDVAVAKDRARQLSDGARAADERREVLERELEAQLWVLPNPCLPAVPKGRDSADNVVVGIHGDEARFDFTPKAHWELAESLGIIDFARGAHLSGSGFVVYRGDGARLQRALINYFLDQHRANGYTEVDPPYLVRPEIMRGTGQLPKFADQLYHCAEDGLYLVPTAEVPVTNLHAGEILEAVQLPIRYCAYTPCFRREAGAAGVGTRGITRVHQFDKVEIVWITAAERSEQDLLTLRGHAEALLRSLDLRYRILDLCTGDTGFGSAHTYDLEVWSPGTAGWLEVSSCSIFTDFQARRMGLRYRPEPRAKPIHAHTLNGSGLALPRCLIAVLERWQQADGSIVVPPVLRPYLGGQDRIVAQR
jgi:seryl-tRNA synthetase